MAKQYYAVIDTNVVVSALLKEDSVPSMVIDLCKNKTIIPLITNDIIDEYREVLSRNGFNFTQEKINSMIETFRSQGIEIKNEFEIDSFIDPDDAIFYEIVMTAKNKEPDSSYLVTGNKRHFPVKPFVVTPREMLEIINGEK